MSAQAYAQNSKTEHSKTEPGRFVSQSGRFSIQMTKPNYEAVAQSTGSDDVQHQFVSGFGQGMFMVAYQDHDDPKPSDQSAQERSYRLFATTFAKSIRGSVQSYSGVSDDQLSGRQFECDLPQQGGKSRSRMFWVGHRFYHVLAMGTKAFVDSDKTEIFLDSFDVAR